MGAALLYAARALLKECTKEWDDYQQHFKDKGMVAKDFPYIPYPYSMDYIHAQYQVHDADMQRNMDRMMKSQAAMNTR